MPEMAQLLGTTRSAVYTILDNPKYSHFFEFIVIAEKKKMCIRDRSTTELGHEGFCKRNIT